MRNEATERTALIDSISGMLSRMDMRRLKYVYEFVLGLSKPTGKGARA